MNRAQEQLVAFKTTEQKTDRKQSALEFLKLKLTQEEYDEYICPSSMLEENLFQPARDWRALEVLHGVESQIKKTYNKLKQNCPVLDMKQRNTYKFGGILQPTLSKEYFTEFHNWYQEETGEQYTEENITDILNEKLFMIMGQPMAKAWAEKYNNTEEENPMGSEYWAEIFMGGFKETEHKHFKETIKRIDERRGTRATGGTSKPRGPSKKETEQQLMIQQQQKEIEELKKLMAEQKPKKKEPEEEAETDSDEEEELDVTSITIDGTEYFKDAEDNIYDPEGDGTPIGKLVDGKLDKSYYSKEVVVSDKKNTIENVIDDLFRKENIKTKENLKTWLGGRKTVNTLCDYAKEKALEHWNSVESPKSHVRWHYQHRLEGYKVYKGDWE